MAIVFLSGAIINTVVFYKYPGIILLSLVVMSSLLTGVCLSNYLDIRRIEIERRKGRMCRMCGQRKPSMALEYGEDEGLCRECLNELRLLLEKPKAE